ncbi:hypothetical protein FGB62_117g037 [Gracilaria domingensis]|nr:hypothetical protein FGB62_117g037 [Gracilaria domingensis]
MYLVRRFSRTVHEQIPSCIAGETKMRKKFPLVLLALRLTDEHEIQRRAQYDKLSFNIDSRIEKGVSGPYELSSLRPQDLVHGLAHRSDQIPDHAVIFALSYNHKHRDPASKTLSVHAAAAVCKALQSIDLVCTNVYFWSDITLARNFARDLWTDDGLMPYIAYPTIKVGTEETYWTSVESDLAHARNAQSGVNDIVSFTRHFVARRRDRCLEEEAPDVDVLLRRMRAVALGMRPSRGKSGLQMVVNSTRIVGPPLQSFTVAKELKEAWHGVSEFVNEGDRIEGDPYRYLCSVIVKCTCMFVLEKDNTCYAVQIYKDGYGDLLVIALSMVRQREGWYRVIKKVRLIPPACDQRQLLELHGSQTSEISLSRMKEILALGDIYANIENVSTKRVDLRKFSMR